MGGNADNGRKLFVQRCAQCHTIDVGGKNKIGPNLFGIIGRGSGQVSGFNYSDGNIKKGVIWSAATLDEFLENPKKFIPGTKMAFPGLKKPQERNDVIAYILSAM